MALLTIIQRALGFFRGIWFCRMMSDVDVGHLSMAYDFVVMCTPIAMLGIPGCLARYVETYRRAASLWPMVSRLAMITFALGVALAATMAIAPSRFGHFLFLDRGTTDLVMIVAACVMAIVIYNFIYELLASLRQVRAASWMQFLQSVVFSVAAVAILYAGGTLSAVLGTFLVATLVAVGLGCWRLWRCWPSPDSVVDADRLESAHQHRAAENTTSPNHPTDAGFVASRMWRRLLPYAASLWVMNVLTNVFAMSDRYMILHWLSDDATASAAAVGQYHSARIIPLLLTSLATMMSGILLPYLSADWESGRREHVRDLLRKAVILVSAVFTVGGAIALAISPWVFAHFLEGRYEGGLAMMPMAMTFCIWIALATIAQDYFWVAERGRWVNAAVGIGLIANIGLNLLWLPVYGLTGAVAATTVSNGLVLVALAVFSAGTGFRWDASMVRWALVPATLMLPAYVTAGCVFAVAAICPHTREAWAMLAGRVSDQVDKMFGTSNGLRYSRLR